MKIIHLYAAFLLLTVPHVSANFKMLVYDITPSSSGIGLSLLPPPNPLSPPPPNPPPASFDYETDVDVVDASSARRRLLSNKTFVVSKISVLDVNGLDVNGVSFDFTSARVKNFSNYDSFKSKLESLLLSNESDREQVTWDLETSQTTTLFTLKSNTEIGAIEFETDTEERKRPV